MKVGDKVKYKKCGKKDCWFCSAVTEKGPSFVIANACWLVVKVDTFDDGLGEFCTLERITDPSSFHDEDEFDRHSGLVRPAILREIHLEVL